MIIKVFQFSQRKTLKGAVHISKGYTGIQNLAQVSNFAYDLEICSVEPRLN